MTLQNPLSRPSAVLRRLVLAVYVACVFLTVAFTKLSIGLPIRSLASIALLSFLMLASFTRFSVAVRRIWLGIALMGFFSLLGAIVSAANGSDAASIARDFIEVHFQSLVSLILTAVVAEWCGARPTLACFIVIVAISVTVAVGQALGIQPLWDLATALATIKGPENLIDLATRRPLGIAYSQTVFAAQLCLGLAAFLISRVHVDTGRRDVSISFATLGWASLAGFLVAFASGNRAPILGIAIGLILYAIRGYGKIVLVLMPVIVLAAFAIDPLLSAGQDLGFRAAQVNDMSSLGRVTLVKYGLLLFIDHPLGYGLDFDSTKLYRDYYLTLSDSTGVELITFVPLHNYLLTILNIYGAVSLICVPLVYYIFSRSWTITILISAYMVHCLFHNSGPFFNELYAWYVVGCVPILLAEARIAKANYVAMPDENAGAAMP